MNDCWDQLGWDHSAKQNGNSEQLAVLGRCVIREAFPHLWPAELQAAWGWEERRREMLRLALEEPERAQIRWKYLLDSDEDFHWNK